MIRVLIMDDVRAICETIAAAVRAEPDLETAGCATTLVEALPHLEACDVIVINSTANGDGALRLVETLRRLAPQVKIVVMGLARGEREATPWIEAGATSYVTKERPLAELLRSMRGAHHTALGGHAAHGSGLKGYLSEWVGFQRGRFADSGPHSLTRREREVISLVRQGLTNQEIAEALVIELGTVKNHVHNILRKLNVSSRREAVHVTGQAGMWGPTDGRAPEGGLGWPARRPAYAGLAAANS
jgi:DNA-binding NarL/FixJ family response regulator